MADNQHIATIPRAEFDELMSIVRAPPDTARPLTDEDRWRRACQAAHAPTAC